MIKESEVLVKINLRNRSYYEKLGYVIDNEIYVSVIDLLPGSKSKVTAICEVCYSENILQYSKYLLNKNRNGKGYYSCFNCKTHVMENTCIERYGVKSYSMTDEFRESESIKWKGTKKGADKGEKTMLERYGVTSYFKTDKSREYNRKWMSSDEFKIKSEKKSETTKPSFPLSPVNSTVRPASTKLATRTPSVSKRSVFEGCHGRCGVGIVSVIDPYLQSD